jgi:hypothetical protein
LHPASASRAVMKLQENGAFGKFKSQGGFTGKYPIADFSGDNKKDSASWSKRSDRDGEAAT